MGRSYFFRELRRCKYNKTSITWGRIRKWESVITVFPYILYHDLLSDIWAVKDAWEKAGKHWVCFGLFKLCYSNALSWAMLVLHFILLWNNIFGDLCTEVAASHGYRCIFCLARQWWPDGGERKYPSITGMRLYILYWEGLCALWKVRIRREHTCTWDFLDI